MQKDAKVGRRRQRKNKNKKEDRKGQGGQGEGRVREKETKTSKSYFILWNALKMSFKVPSYVIYIQSIIYTIILGTYIVNAQTHYLEKKKYVHPLKWIIRKEHSF